MSHEIELSHQNAFLARQLWDVGTKLDHLKRATVVLLAICQFLFERIYEGQARDAYASLLDGLTHQLHRMQVLQRDDEQMCFASSQSDLVLLVVRYKLQAVPTGTCSQIHQMIEAAAGWVMPPCAAWARLMHCCGHPRRFDTPTQVKKTRGPA
ncbi:MAG: hypothetical protein AAGK92_12145 [Pseudomonadota bacterium]